MLTSRPGNSRYTSALLVALILGLIVWAQLMSWAPVWLTAVTLALVVWGAVAIARRAA